MIELFKKYQKLFYIIIPIIIILIILSILLHSSIFFLGLYFCIIGIYVYYSFSWLKQINTYGYTGDWCRPMKWIYYIVSIVIIVTSIIFLILV